MAIFDEINNIVSEGNLSTLRQAEENIKKKNKPKTSKLKSTFDSGMKSAKKIGSSIKKATTGKFNVEKLKNVGDEMFDMALNDRISSKDERKKLEDRYGKSKGFNRKAFNASNSLNFG